MNLKGKKINFLGDSITEGCGTSAKDKIYLNILKERCGLAEARNYGISGTRIADYLGEDPGNWGPSFAARFGEMETEADAVVVFGGTNDFGHGNAPLGSFGDTEPNTFYGALDTLMRGLTEKYPDANIVFMTPLHRREELKKNPNSGKVFKDYVYAIKEMAEYYSIPVLDLYAISGIQPCIESQKARLCPDGLHPNDLGHIRIADCLERFLKQL